MKPDHPIASESRPHVISSVNVNATSGRSNIRCVKKINRRAERPGDRVPERHDRMAHTDTPKTADKAASLRRRDSRSSSSNATASAPVNSVDRASAQASEPPERNFAGRAFNVDNRYGHRTGTLSRKGGNLRGGVGGAACPCPPIAQLEAMDRMQNALGHFALPLPSRHIRLSSPSLLRALSGLEERLRQPQPLREKMNRLKAHAALSRAVVHRGRKLSQGRRVL